MDGDVWDESARVLDEGLPLADENEREWIMNQLLYVNDTSLVAESEKGLQKLVTEGGRVRERRKLGVNVGKNKVMRRVRVQYGGRLNVRLNGELLEKAESFKYLGSTVAVNGGMDMEVYNRGKEASAWVERRV